MSKSDVLKLENENLRLETDLEKYKSAFENLVARLDRDGGQAQHGKSVDQNLKRADKIAAELIVAKEELKEELGQEQENHDKTQSLATAMAQGWLDPKEGKVLLDKIMELQKKIDETPVPAHNEFPKEVRTLLLKTQVLLMDIRGHFAGQRRADIGSLIDGISKVIPN